MDAVDGDVYEARLLDVFTHVRAVHRQPNYDQQISKQASPQNQTDVQTDRQTYWQTHMQTDRDGHTLRAFEQETMSVRHACRGPSNGYTAQYGEGGGQPQANPNHTTETITNNDEPTDGG